MTFTNNIIFIMVLIFFAIYFTIFNDKIFKFNVKYPLYRIYYIAAYSTLFYATWYPPAILLLIYYSFLSHFTKILKSHKGGVAEARFLRK